MTKALLVALCLVSFTTLAETKLNFNGDAFVRGYFLNGTGPDHTQAFNQFFRLNVDAKPDEHLTIKTGLVLSGNTWEGDKHHTNAINSTVGTDGGGGDTTRLDHAVIEYNKDGWVTSAGRQVVSTPGNFLTSDDRRDRIQVLKFFSNYNLLAFAYDKRAEGALSQGKDDLDMYSVSFYGTYNNLRYAIQTGYWVSKRYSNTTNALEAVNLDNIKQISPQLSGTYLGVDFDIYYTLLFNGSGKIVTNFSTLTSEPLYNSDHHAFAFKLAKDLSIMKVEYESAITKNGGLIANGFDTLSSVINNSPDHKQSSIKLKSIGLGLGRSNADEYTHMLRFSKIISNDLQLSIGGGFAKLYTFTETETSASIEDDTVLDATAKYTISKNLNFAAAYGKFFGDNKDHAGSLTLNANF